MARESFVDYYAVLGVPKDADDEVLRKAYRESARRYHPDVNKSAGADFIFKQINTAHNVLSDNNQRKAYDLTYKLEGARSSALEVVTLLSRKTLRRSAEPQMLYVMLRVSPLLEMGRSTNAPMNLCLLIDRSKSMENGRLHHVKSAAHKIIDEASEQDIISVVSFGDDADVIVEPQHPIEKHTIKSQISGIRANGSTEMLKGLQTAVRQINRYRSPEFVNHLVLITDGRTYGDEPECLDLARDARDEGIGISGMGIGEDWNDNFLDKLSSITGGSSSYISTDSAVLEFVQNKIKSLATAYAERSQLVVASAANVVLDSMTRISPDPIELDANQQPLTMGTLDGLTPTTVVMEFHVTTGEEASDRFTLGRINVQADVLGSNQHTETVTRDMVVSVGDEPEQEPPPELLDAIQSLMFYRLQERANEALGEGKVHEATRNLEHLATRLFENGEEELGRAAIREAQRVSQTHMLSENGSKQLKYGTRALMLPEGTDGDS